MTAELHAAPAARQRAIVHEAALRERLLNASIELARLQRTSTGMEDTV